MKGFIVGFATCLVVMSLYFTGGNLGVFADTRKAEADQVLASQYAQNIEVLTNSRRLQSN